jgi:excisionase family DNA binding protein
VRYGATLKDSREHQTAHADLSRPGVSLGALGTMTEERHMPPSEVDVHAPVQRETLTVPEAAQRLGCSRGTAYRLAREGTLPVLRLGRRMVVPRVAFEQWLASAAPQVSEANR